MTEQEIIERMGCLLRNFPYEHDREYKYGFDIAHNTFLQKLVPIEIMEGHLDIENDDYLRSLLFIDYFVNVIDRGNNQIIGKYDTLYRWKRERDEHYRLDMEAIVMEAGLYAKREKPEDFLTSEKNVSEIKKAFDEKNVKVNFESDGLKPNDLYYEGIGSMVYHLVSDENKKGLQKIIGKYELKSLVFTDIILQYVKDDKLKTKVKEQLSNGEFFPASLTALYGLSREVDLSWLRKYAEKSESLR
jgi:hypothetical protein